MNFYKTYSAEETKLFKYLDRSFINLASDYQVQEWEIPTLINSDVLRKCGYFETMPNQLTPIGYIKREAIENVILGGRAREEDVSLGTLYLAPAACLHVYPMLEKTIVEDTVITVKGHAFRYEDCDFKEGKRQWDFTIREFIAVGKPEFVKNFLEYFKHKSLEFAKSCELDCQVNVACDLFFPNKQNNLMKMRQKANGLKYELILQEEELAIGSFNYHGFHFSKPFHFDQNGEVVSGCVGFGLDRWINSLQKVNGGRF